METLRLRFPDGLLTTLQFGHGFGAVETPCAPPLRALLSLGFNSATDLGPWKLAVCRLNCLRHLRFNSATDLGPWKRFYAGNFTSVATGLQFGHGFGAVETANSGLVIERHGGKLQFGHGFGAVETGNLLAYPCAAISFNSATDLGPWKLAGHPPTWIAFRASIRPRIWGRGNLKGQAGARLRQRKLQFGHGFGAVETFMSSGTFQSTIKLQFGLGFGAVETRGGCWVADWMAMLQFGHGFGAVETQQVVADKDRRKAASIRPRIWGRGNMPSGAPRDTSDSSFNSATDLGPWKHGDFLTGTLHGLELQFGHGFGAVETSAQFLAGGHHLLELQFGHGFGAVETQRRQAA